MVQVIVKWGKQSFEVELDTSESAETFKAQLFALTSVPIERQKIMGVKGGTLKVCARAQARCPGWPPCPAASSRPPRALPGRR